MMKRMLIFMLLSLVFTTSCSIDGDTNPPNFFNEFMAIQSADVPDEFIFGETHEIFVTYNRPNDCYEYSGILFDSNNAERTVVVVNNVYTDIQCAQVTEPVTVSFDFTVVSTDTHVFKFYQGTDAQGLDQFLIVEIPVVE